MEDGVGGRGGGRRDWLEGVELEIKLNLTQLKLGLGLNLCNKSASFFSETPRILLRWLLLGLLYCSRPDCMANLIYIPKPAQSEMKQAVSELCQAQFS